MVEFTDQNIGMGEYQKDMAIRDNDGVYGSVSTNGFSHSPVFQLILDRNF